MTISQKIQASKHAFYSLEFFPPKEAAHYAKFYDAVAALQALKPLFASVTYGAGGSNQSGSLEVLQALRKQCDTPLMAHLTCVGANEERIAEFTESVAAMGVNTILALRGDPPADAAEPHRFDGPFKHASDLVRFVKAKYPAIEVAVAGYPTPHPESPTFASDWQYTVEKIRTGADFVVTQLFFDVREYFSLKERLAALGVHVPIIPGILPVQSLESLKRTLMMCGANIPGKLFLEMEAHYARGGNQAVKEAGIAFAVQQIQSLLEGGAPGVHLYTLNQAATCLRIMEEVGPLERYSR